MVLTCRTYCVLPCGKMYSKCWEGKREKMHSQPKKCNRIGVSRTRSGVIHHPNLSLIYWVIPFHPFMLVVRFLQLCRQLAQTNEIFIFLKVSLLTCHGKQISIHSNIFLRNLLYFLQFLSRDSCQGNGGWVAVFSWRNFGRGMDPPVGLDDVVGKGLSGAIDPPGAKESVVKKEPSDALRPDVGHDSYDSHLFGGGFPVFRIPAKPVRHQSLRLRRRATASQCLQSMSRPCVTLTTSKPWASNGRGHWLTILDSISFEPNV